jgi:hypothetical protein
VGKPPRCASICRDTARWLLATKPIVEDAAFYLERTGEAWSTGQPLDERG